jgi:hypothetical protein
VGSCARHLLVKKPTNKTENAFSYNWDLTPMIDIRALIGESHRKSTIYCRYLTILCDNLKKRMFLQNFFSWHNFRNFVMFFPVIHLIPLLYSQTISLWTEKSFLKKIFFWPRSLIFQSIMKLFWRNILVFKLSHNMVSYR